MPQRAWQKPEAPWRWQFVAVALKCACRQCASNEACNGCLGNVHLLPAEIRLTQAHEIARTDESLFTTLSNHFGASGAEQNDACLMWFAVAFEKSGRRAR